MHPLRLLLLASVLLPCHAFAGSIYLCKSYSGGTFWSSAHCGQHNALIDRIVSVPESLPWDQQVQLAEQDRAQRAAAGIGATTSTTTVTTSPGAAPSGPSKQAECSALSAQASSFDSMARQPQSGQMQDWIREQKRRVTDRQFQLRC